MTVLTNPVYERHFTRLKITLTIAELLVFASVQLIRSSALLYWQRKEELDRLEGDYATPPADVGDRTGGADPQ